MEEKLEAIKTLHKGQTMQKVADNYGYFPYQEAKWNFTEQHGARN